MLMKLASSTWVTSANTLQSAAEYCAPVWSHCTHKSGRCPCLVTLCTHKSGRCPCMVTLCTHNSGRCPCMVTLCTHKSGRCPCIVTLCTHKSGRCAVELFFHVSHLWYPLFYTSPMASSALQHWTASPTKEGCHWQAGGENRQTWQLANPAWYP